MTWYGPPLTIGGSNRVSFCWRESGLELDLLESLFTTIVVFRVGYSSDGSVLMSGEMQVKLKAAFKKQYGHRIREISVDIPSEVNRYTVRRKWSRDAEVRVR